MLLDSRVLSESLQNLKILVKLVRSTKFSIFSHFGIFSFSSPSHCISNGIYHRFASNKQTVHLFEQIAKTPKQEYDSKMLQLIKTTTLQAFKKQEAWDRTHSASPQPTTPSADNGGGTASGGTSDVMRDPKQNDDPRQPLNPQQKVNAPEPVQNVRRKPVKKSWFGLDLLWKFVQSADAADSGSKEKRLISEKTAREALNIFLELLADDYALSQRNAYMEKCIWHIQEVEFFCLILE